MSPCHVTYCEACLWPSDHMISWRPLISQPSFPKNKELFWIAYMDYPGVGGVWLVDWCTRRRGAVYDCTYGWSTRERCSTGGLVHFGPSRRALKTRSRSSLFFYFLFFSSQKKYWCFYSHRSRVQYLPYAGFLKRNLASSTNWQIIWLFLRIDSKFSSFSEFTANSDLSPTLQSIRVFFPMYY